MSGAASQAGDTDSSRAPGLTSGLQGSMNVHHGALLLVPQWQFISYFVFSIEKMLSTQSAKASVRHTLQPLCDLSATKIQNECRGRREVATRFCSWSATGWRLIGDWLQLPTDQRLVGDLVGTSLRLDATGRRPVGDLRLVADQSPIRIHNHFLFHRLFGALLG